MRRVWVGGAAAVLAVVGLFLAWHTAGSQSVLARTAEALRKVKSYQCRYSGVETGADEDKEKWQEVGVVYWAAPGSYRMDFHERGKCVTVSIAIRGKPGLEVDHKSETYQRVEPFHQPDSPLELLHELARFAADKGLGGYGVTGLRVRSDSLVTPNPLTPNPLRLRAWHTCFTGQLAVLTDPTALRTSESAVAAAAETLRAAGDTASPGWTSPAAGRSPRDPSRMCRTAPTASTSCAPKCSRAMVPGSS